MNLLLLALSALLGWLVGGFANWLADALPAWPTPAFQPFSLRGGSAAHYWTLGWRPWRSALCPHCWLRRSWRAPLLEAAMIGIFGGAPLLQMLQGGQLRWDRLLLFWAYAAFLLVVIVIDYEQRRVLNIMLLPAYPLALLFSFAAVQPDPWHALLGGVVGFALFLFFAILGRGALGMGDVKLAGLIGVMTGYPAVLSALVLGILLAGLAAILLLISRRAGRKSTMAYAPYMAMGAMVVLWQVLRQ